MLHLRFVHDGEDHIVPLQGNRVRLGRGSDNDIVLPDVSVSRYHAELSRESDGWVVQDLKSTNGVEVNRVSVQRAPLRAGDRLAIGIFDVLLEPALGSTASQDRGEARDLRGMIEDTGPVLINATIVRPLAEFAAAYGLASGGTGPITGTALTPLNTTAEQSDDDRRFAFLGRLARILLVAEAVDEVLQRLLDIAFEALPVDRGFVHLDIGDGELACELMRIKDRVEVRPSGEIPVSRTMLRAVVKERVALVTFDAQSDQRLSGGESIRLHQIRAAMCVPLWSGETIIGVMQVDSPFQVGAFTERDLDFLTTLANFAAVAVERIRWARQAELEKSRRSRLERYHSPAVVEEVLRQEGDEGGMSRLRSTQATVLFADLVGFTSFAESSQPEEVADSLDAFLNLAVEAIFRAGGTLDKFIGDCVMAFFGAPVAQDDHALRATRAAVEIQRDLSAWNEQRTEQGLPGFRARVALNSGLVVVGDIGSARRVDYTVLGNTVNVAARLEALVAQPGDVVIGPETWRLLDGALPTEALGEFQLKGLRQKIQAYRVVM